MNLQSLVVIAIRLLALNSFLKIVVTFLPQIYLYGESFRQSAGESPVTFVYLLAIAALITGTFMLWSLALPIAQRITAGLPLELNFGALSRVDCYSIAFIGVGVWLVAVHFAQSLGWAHYLFRLAASDGTSGEETFSQVNGYDIFGAVVPLIIGIILVQKGRRWAHRLAARDERLEALEAQKIEE
jgi:hypothetical protein